MASKQLVIVLAVVFVVLPAVVRATDYVVGDEKGWGLEVNYTAWAETKEFRVGDTICQSKRSQIFLTFSTHIINDRTVFNPNTVELLICKNSLFL
jgi:hypothetical protein